MSETAAPANNLPNGSISVEVRQARTEARVEALSADVGQLVVTVDRLVSTVSKQISDIHERFAVQGRTNWVPIAAFLSLGVTIIVAFTTLVFTFYGRDLTRVETDTKLLLESRVDASYHRGVSDETRRFAARDVVDLGQQVKNLDTALQREMRDVNATTEAKLIGLDKRIQEEITRNVSERHVQIAQLRTMVEGNAAFQNVGIAVHADHEARIKGLEDRKP